MAIIYFTGTESNDLWLYDLKRWHETGELERINVAIGKTAQSFPIFSGGELLLQTTLGCTQRPDRRRRSFEPRAKELAGAGRRA